MACFLDGRGLLVAHIDDALEQVVGQAELGKGVRLGALGVEDWIHGLRSFHFRTLPGSHRVLGVSMGGG